MYMDLNQISDVLKNLNYDANTFDLNRVHRAQKLLFYFF